MMIMTPLAVSPPRPIPNLESSLDEPTTSTATGGVRVVPPMVCQPSPTTLTWSQDDNNNKEEKGGGLAESPSSLLAPRIRRSPRLSISPMLLLQPLATTSTAPTNTTRPQQRIKNKLPPTLPAFTHKTTTTLSQLEKESPPREKIDKENFINQLTTSRHHTEALNCTEHDTIAHAVFWDNDDNERSNPSPVPPQKVLLAIHNQKLIRVRIVFEDDTTDQGISDAIVSVVKENVISPTNLPSSSSLSPNHPSNSTPTNQSTTTSSGNLLKSLLTDTRRNLKEDGTPHEPKERRVFEEDDDHDNDDAVPVTNMDDSLLPSVSNLQPCSPMAAPKNITMPATSIGIQQLNDRMHQLFPFLRYEKEGKVSDSFRGCFHFSGYHFDSSPFRCGSELHCGTTVCLL